MADDITDLTEDADGEESAANGDKKGKKGKKEKKPKKEKAPKEKKPKKEKAPKEKKPKKEKAPKAPKAPKPPKPKKAPKPPKEPKAKKGKPAGPTTQGEGGSPKLLIIIIAAVLVISGVIASSIIFNLFGVRDGVRDTLISAAVALDPEFSAVEQELVRRAASINSREQELIRLEAHVLNLQNELIDTGLFVPPGTFDTFEDFMTAFANELIRLEAQVNTREAQLDRREAAIDRREVQVVNQENIRIPMFRRNLTEDEIADITSLSRSFSNMSPDEAAEILTELGDLNQVATILFFMTERNSAAILAVMEVAFAAELTQILLTE